MDSGEPRKPGALWLTTPSVSPLLSRFQPQEFAGLTDELTICKEELLQREETTEMKAERNKTRVSRRRASVFTHRTPFSPLVHMSQWSWMGPIFLRPCLICEEK